MDFSPLWISLEVSLFSTIVASLIALPLAKIITRVKIRRIIDILLSLPLVLPPTVVGFFLLILFGRNSVFGRLLTVLRVNIVFTITGAVIAAVVVSFPIIYRTARVSFEQVDSDLVDMARLMGYGGVSLFLHVYIPLSFHQLAAAVTLAFARAIGEFGATIMVAGNIPGKTRTMSVAVYTAMQGGDRKLAYTWTVIILCLSFTMLFLMEFFAERQYRSGKNA